MKAVRLKEVSPLDDLRALAKAVRGTGRKVPEEIKARAVELYVGGFAAGDVALAAGVHSTNLYKWSRERAVKTSFRALDLSEPLMAPPSLSREVKPPATASRPAGAECVVFRFPRGTHVTLPASHATPSVIEALLSLERG